MKSEDVAVCLDGRCSANLSCMSKALDPHESVSKFSKDLYVIHEEMPETACGQVEVVRFLPGAAMEVPPSDATNLYHEGSLRSNVLASVRSAEKSDLWSVKGALVRHWPTTVKLCDELVHRATRFAKAKGILDLYAVDGTLAASAAKAGVPYAGASVRNRVVVISGSSQATHSFNN